MKPSRKSDWRLWKFLAKAFHIPPTLIDRAQRIKERSPAIFEQVFNGKLTIAEAEAKLAEK